MNSMGYVVLAVVFPVAWGLLSAWAFDKIRARRSTSESDCAEPESGE